jgi:acylphosphatase
MSSPPDRADRTACEVTVHGIVQGVSFRYYCRREANRLGVTGWVRNEPDGTVAAHFEGASDAVRALVSWCEHGPSAARVDRVEERPASWTGATGFSAG